MDVLHPDPGRSVTVVFDPARVGTDRASELFDRVAASIAGLNLEGDVAIDWRFGTVDEQRAAAESAAQAELAWKSTQHNRRGGLIQAALACPGAVDAKASETGHVLLVTAAPNSDDRAAAVLARTVAERVAAHHFGKPMQVLVQRMTVVAREPVRPR